MAMGVMMPPMVLPILTLLRRACRDPAVALGFVCGHGGVWLGCTLLLAGERMLAFDSRTVAHANGILLVIWALLAGTTP